MSKPETIGRDSGTEIRNSRAKEIALQAAASLSVEPTSAVAYHSDGRLLVIGEASEALAISAMLKGKALHCCVLARGEGLSRVEGDLPVLSISPRLAVHITGCLGEFTVKLGSEEQGEIDLAQAMEVGFSHFDLVLDLSMPPLLNWEMLPLGYYAPRGDETVLLHVVAELPAMVGEFEKAKFFHYHPDLCVHGSSGLQGCRRCLDACPTGAITSLRDKITVDPYRCQGAGSCATACPSGAIIYGFPKPADTLNRLRTLLRTYAEAGGRDAVLLFHDSQAVKHQPAQFTDRLPGNVIAIEVEEVGSIGMEIWLSALAYGASRVIVLETPAVPPSVQRELHEQLGFSHALLAGMAYPTAVLQLINPAEKPVCLAELVAGPAMPPIKPANFAGSNAKRDTLFFAIDYLAAQSLPPKVMALPKHAPFGEVRVNPAACTLCLACVSVCPVAALFDGVDRPRLDFLEANCVQCGLCEQACPEAAITLRPRFLFDPQQRRRRQLLHEEEAFCCISCGKPFATRSMIERIKAKLNGHSMFGEEAAFKRLQLCGDCRVHDMFGSGGNMPK